MDPPGGMDRGGGRAGDGNNNAGAAFGGAPAALGAAGVVPVPGPALPGGIGGFWGAEVPQEGQPPKCRLRLAPVSRGLWRATIL